MVHGMYAMVFVMEASKSIESPAAFRRSTIINPILGRG